MKFIIRVKLAGALFCGQSAGFIARRPVSSVFWNSYSSTANNPLVIHPFLLYSQKNNRNDLEPQQQNEDEDSPVLVDAIDLLIDFVSTPTPLVPSLALGFPVALLLVTITQSWSNTVTTVILFTFLAWFGRSVALDEDGVEESGDATPTMSTVGLDALAFLTAIGTAQLLVPSEDEGFLDWGVLTGVSFAVLAVVQVLRTPLPKDTPEERLMDRWDDRFRQNRKVNGQKKKSAIGKMTNKKKDKKK
ncbi:hypothetical protein FisN_25Lh175 [Fistulifera solaris]|uniref:Uncharacterized protein n=1 Tax=Fistulifera solaris TaxID=1519565 RepID=A0A1Z5KS58_FISSO|nr:hypothetical protein FisN_25Lh175 [Fistulifera solaris]|eukprot:GAX28768.1 hypothetical protein FisN_25Lh175 [Fistulifera solaris]